MIVLDEQLLSNGVQASIARWYWGTITDITRLRPNTVISDKAIPMLPQGTSCSRGSGLLEESARFALAPWRWLTK